MTHPNDRAHKLLLNSVQVCSPYDVQLAIAKIANELNDRFLTEQTESFPLILSVMTGAIFFSGQLLPTLAFPLEFDFLHVSRYGNSEQGSDVIWKVIPRQNVMNRVVVILDDILDEGQTLFHIKNRLLDMGASQVITVVLVEKDLPIKKPIVPDHVGLLIPNQFVIGCGMDIEGFWRNLPDIRALTIDPSML